jgi:hypothetical protein
MCGKPPSFQAFIFSGVRSKVMCRRRLVNQTLTYPKSSWPPTGAAIHFPEAVQEFVRLWKMVGRDKPGHDGIK